MRVPVDYEIHSELPRRRISHRWSDPGGGWHLEHGFGTAAENHEPYPDTGYQIRPNDRFRSHPPIGNSSNTLFSG